MTSHLADPQSLAAGFIILLLTMYILHLSIQHIHFGIFFSFLFFLNYYMHQYP